MGLNFVKRPKREQFDVPNEFIAVSFGEEDRSFSHYDEHVILEYVDKQLDKVDIARRELFQDS